MKINLILAIFLINISNLASAQFFYLYGDKAYGGTENENAGNILMLKDNSLLITGSSLSEVGGNKTLPLCNPSLLNENDLWTLKIDTAFNILWQQNIGGNNIDRFSFLSLNSDSAKIFFSCKSKSDSSCSKGQNNKSFPAIGDDYWVGELDNTGNVLWDKTIGGDGIEEGSKIYELTTGEFIVIGTSISQIGGDKSVSNYGGWDFWLVKLDDSGNKIWDRVYGGTDTEGSPEGDISLIPLPGGEFLFGSRTFSQLSGTISDTSRGFSDIWITKVDSSGNQIWDKRFGGSLNEDLTDIKKTTDNGFILCGTTRSPQDGDVSDTSRGQRDIWIIKIDSLGNKMWDKRYGGLLTEYGKSIHQDFDGGYWIAGTVKSGAGLDVSEPAYGTTDYWVIKTDSLGNKIWDKRFGSGGDNFLSNLLLLPDSSVMLFGHADAGISPVKSDSGYGLQDYWLVHFRYSDSLIGINDIQTDNDDISIYPNPSSDFITVEINNNSIPVTFTLCDLTGKIIFSYPIASNKSIDISKLPPSMYIYEVIDINKQSFKGKFIKND